MTGPDVYCASPKAIKAASLAYGPTNNAYLLADALIAAHHENLGLDRSVCLRDVVEWMRSRLEPGGTWDYVADVVEREFS